MNNNKRCSSTVAVLLAVLGSPSIRTDAADGIEILFEGNQVFTADQLRSAMSRGRVPQATRVSEATESLQQGLQQLREFLVAEGYLTPRIGKPHITQGPTGLVLRVSVEEGPLYRLGAVKVTGATVFSETQIIEALDIKQGDTFKGDAIRRWFEKMGEMYANSGYPDFTPVPRQEVREPDSEFSDGIVNLTIDLDEGSRM